MTYRTSYDSSPFSVSNCKTKFVNNNGFLFRMRYNYKYMYVDHNTCFISRPYLSNGRAYGTVVVCRRPSVVVVCNGRNVPKR